MEKKLVVRSSSNISMARSLLEKAEVRLKRIAGNKIKEEEASIIFEDIYESLREAAQSLMEISGYKPYSHEALVSFIQERKFLSEEKVNVLDNYRILRNNSVYKAEKVSLSKCLEALKFVKEILPELKNKFEGLIEEKG